MVIYILTNIETGEVIRGNSEEMERLGFTEQVIRHSIIQGVPYAGYKCAKGIYKSISSKKKRKTKTATGVDEIQKKAHEKGLSYGAYVALYDNK